MIDFRSDTVTKPTKGMLKAMMNAKVGDDVFSEDPSINQLESRIAKMFSKEDAIFCPSGTMCNQIAIKVHTQPGDEVICSKLSHIYHYEGGGMAMNSGVTAKMIDCDRGIFTSEQVKDSINPIDIHKARTSLVSLEDTCNKGGGSVWPIQNIKKISELCRDNKLALHLDGARVFNALQVNGIRSEDYGKLFDTISICLSKGLGAPVGSLLLGSKAFVTEARRVRKVFGGGMRQAGYLAAAGLYALDNHIDRLTIDHTRAKEAAKALSRIDAVDSVKIVETNIVIFNIIKSKSPSEFITILNNKGVKAISMGGQSVRIVYHLDISEEDHKTFLSILGKL